MACPPQPDCPIRFKEKEKKFRQIIPPLQNKVKVFLQWNWLIEIPMLTNKERKRENAYHRKNVH